MLYATVRGSCILQLYATVREGCVLGGGVPLYLYQPYPITHHLHALGKRDLGTHVNK